MLFDGKTTKGWRGYKMEKMPPGWQVMDGALVRASGRAGGKGHISLQDHTRRLEFRSIKIRVLSASK